MVAKVDPRPGRGELWLSACPTADTMSIFLAFTPSIQICCLTVDPATVRIKHRVRGAHIPRTQLWRVEMSNSATRASDFRAVAPLLVRSLYAGDNAVVHCMTGLCRGPFAAALSCAVLHQEPLREAWNRIETLRNTQLPDRAWETMGGIWAEQVAGMAITLPRYPVGFAAALSDNAVVHAVISAARDAEASGASGSAADSRTEPPPQYVPLCKWKQGASAGFQRPPAFSLTVRDARAFSSRFCRECRPLLIASHQIAVESAFGSDSSSSLMRR
jgi:hypothetical protein